MTVIYLIRHSKATKNSFYMKYANKFLKNKKMHLDFDGIEIANIFFNNPLFKSVDSIYSSDYNRAKETASILGKKINKNVIIDKRLGERKHGNVLVPVDFELKQMIDANYKLDGGESQFEVKMRMLDVLNEIIGNNQNKNVAIFSHSTAIAFLLKNWCEVNYCDCYKFNGNVFFDGKWNYCETFKLTFENNKLINIENIKYNV